MFFKNLSKFCLKNLSKFCFLESEHKNCESEIRCQPGQRIKYRRKKNGFVCLFCLFPLIVHGNVLSICATIFGFTRSDGSSIFASRALIIFFPLRRA